jgi:hypothetical protein
MRNWIIAAAALVAVVAPGVAAAQTGYVGAVYGNVDPDGAGDEDFYGLEGAVAFSGSGSIVFEVDASIFDADDTDTSYGLTGHVLMRNDSHAVGGFIGLSDANETAWYGGVEANKYFDNFTVAGALFYGQSETAVLNDDVEGYGLNVEGRYFVQDNFRVDANIGYASIDVDNVGDDDVMVYGVGAEYQLAEFPVSFRAGYSTADSDFGDADVWSIGVRYNWGGQTLRDRDRSGASQASLTDLGRLFAY